MPANLTPQYKEAEQRYRSATDDRERLQCLQDMLRVIPKHKGTEKLQAEIKRRLPSSRKGRAASRQSQNRRGWTTSLARAPHRFRWSVPQTAASRSSSGQLPTPIRMSPTIRSLREHQLPE